MVEPEKVDNHGWFEAGSTCQTTIVPSTETASIVSRDGAKTQENMMSAVM